MVVVPVCFFFMIFLRSTRPWAPPRRAAGVQCRAPGSHSASQPCGSGDAGPRCRRSPGSSPSRAWRCSTALVMLTFIKQLIAEGRSRRDAILGGGDDPAAAGGHDGLVASLASCRGRSRRRQVPRSSGRSRPVCHRRPDQRDPPDACGATGSLCALRRQGRRNARTEGRRGSTALEASGRVTNASAPRPVQATLLLSLCRPTFHGRPPTTDRRGRTSGYRLPCAP